MPGHTEDIEKICKKEFNQAPEKVERMTVGSANEVYAATIKEKEYIVRLNEDPRSLQGSDKYIPLFKSLGIKVPDIVAEDYSKSITSFNYQIQTRLEGVDIDKTIASLSENQLTAIAQEVATIAKKLIVLPTNGKFGWVGFFEEGLKDTWFDWVMGMFAMIKERNVKTNVVGDTYIAAFEKAMGKYAEYLRHIPSQFYFDDMSSKNVMIHNGVFNGLVDLDGVAYGDYLEGIGRIKGSWYGTRYGTVYTEAVEDALGLNGNQKEIVTLYAFLNRISWLSEHGVQFNQNTSTDVNAEKVANDKVVIDGLLKELNL